MHVTIPHSRLRSLRYDLREIIPGLGSAHASEVVAAGFGFATHAAFGAWADRMPDPLFLDFDVLAALSRLEVLTREKPPESYIECLLALLGDRGSSLDLVIDAGLPVAVAFEALDAYVSSGGEPAEWVASRAIGRSTIRELVRMLAEAGRIGGPAVLTRRSCRRCMALENCTKGCPAPTEDLAVSVPATMTAAVLRECLRDGSFRAPWFPDAWRFARAPTRSALDAVVTGDPPRRRSFAPSVGYTGPENLRVVVMGQAKDDGEIGLADHGWSERHDVSVLREAAVGAFLLSCWQGKQAMFGTGVQGWDLPAVHEGLRRSRDPLSVMGQFMTVDPSLDSLSVDTGEHLDPYVEAPSLPHLVDGGFAVVFSDERHADQVAERMSTDFDLSSASFNVMGEVALDAVLDAVEASTAEIVRLNLRGPATPLEKTREKARTGLLPGRYVLISGDAGGVVDLMRATRRREALLECGFSGPAIVPPPGTLG